MSKLLEILRHLFDGPLRTRTFWLLIFAALVDFTTNYCGAFGQLCVDLQRFEPIINQIINFLVLVGILHATRTVTPVNDIDVAWSMETLERNQELREQSDEPFDEPFDEGAI